MTATRRGALLNAAADGAERSQSLDCCRRRTFVLLMALATTDRATETFNTLQSVFWSNNMWRSSMWWQAANTVEAIAKPRAYKRRP